MVDVGNDRDREDPGREAETRQDGRSLPIAEVDGSLKKRFQNLAQPGRLRLKTGLLKDVRALAGYVIDRKGDIWVVVILHNDPRATQPIGIEIQHRLLKTLFQ